MNNRRRKASVSSGNVVAYKRKLRSYRGRRESEVSFAPTMLVHSYPVGREHANDNEVPANNVENPQDEPDEPLVSCNAGAELEANVEANTEPVQEEGPAESQEMSATGSSSSGNTSSTLAVQNASDLGMNSVPFEFCTQVIANFRSISELENLSGVWRAAYLKAAQKRRVYEFFLRVARKGNDPLAMGYAITPINWEYQFSGTNCPTIEELLKMDRRYVQINHIVIKNNIASHPSKPFHPADLEKITKVVLPFVGQQLMNKVEFDCWLSPTYTYIGKNIFEKIGAYRIFKNISLSYCGPASEEFLSKQVDSGEIWELSLSGDWPLSSQYILVKFVTTSFWYVSMRESNFEMDKTLFSVIYNHWKKGLSRGFKIISAIDRIGRQRWREFFGPQHPNNTSDDYLILKHPDNENEYDGEQQRNLRLNFEAEGRVTLWC
ncbi:hypothetical protein QR680_000137 [Steinernema hermaphroditum]|uniref:Uncharacterized protein n=1 Tax=Steinernema hermaphroditum TaxID=289476 RepID=A0AA39GTI6_9BILA|nr:hypothetical protein QR680_000137 [Steinernema hermaphroditum]